MKVNAWISSLFLLSAVASAFPTINTIDQDLARRDEDLTMQFYWSHHPPRQVRKPAAKPVAKKSAPKPAAKPAAKPAKKPAARPAAKPVAKPAAKKPAAKKPVAQKPALRSGAKNQPQTPVPCPKKAANASTVVDKYVAPKAQLMNREHCGIFIALKPNVPAGFVTGTLLDSVNTKPGQSYELMPRWKENHITDPQNRFKGGAIGSITSEGLAEFKARAWPSLRAPNGVETEAGSTTVADCQTFTGQIRAAMGPYMS